MKVFLLLFLFAVASRGYIQRDVMMPMRDGVQLHTILLRSNNSADEPRPMLLARTPYGASELIGACNMWADQGYQVALQDVRGLF
jgi:uncharacterized protein